MQNHRHSSKTVPVASWQALRPNSECAAHTATHTDVGEMKKSPTPPK